MSSLYVVNDVDGFISAFKTKKEAEEFICNYGKQHRLYIMMFTDAICIDANDIWFLPYRELHVPVVVSSNDQYVKNIQLQLLKMNLVYPDNIDFYKRKIGEVGPYEKHRLLLPDIDEQTNASINDDEQTNASINDDEQTNASINDDEQTIINVPIVMEQPQLLTEILTDAMRESYTDCIAKEVSNY